MKVTFPSVIDAYIRAKVADGFYASAAELVIDAVRRLRERDDPDYVNLIDALEEGERDIREGRTTPYSPDLLQEILREAQEQVEGRGRPASSDPT
jgi:Arc/MetJ-type ribon-helix-helix transcriptional regulator